MDQADRPGSSARTGLRLGDSVRPRILPESGRRLSPLLVKHFRQATSRRRTTMNTLNELETLVTLTTDEMARIVGGAIHESGCIVFPTERMSANEAAAIGAL